MHEQKPPGASGGFSAGCLEDYGTEQAIGATKHRIQELGATFQKEDILDHARRTHDLAVFNKETERLRRLQEGVKQVEEAASRLFQAIADHASRTSTGVPSLEMKFARGDASIAIATPTASVSVWLNTTVVRPLKRY